MPPGLVRRIIVRTLFVALGLSAPLLILEAALRFFGPVLPGNYAASLYREPHRRYGWFNTPASGGFVRTSEFTVRVDFNSRGLREREIPYENPTGARRVLVLGDSFVQGSEVPVDATFTRQVESLLNQRSDRATQVINAGVAGFGTGQEYLFLKHDVGQYKPDLVVLVFYIGNDVTNNSYRLRGSPNGRDKPYFVLDSHGNLRPLTFTARERSQEGWQEKLRRESLLFGVLDTGVFSKTQWSGADESDEPDRPTQILLRYEFPVYSDHPTSTWNDAWDVTEALLDAARDEAARNSARFLLVSAPSKWEIYPREWEDFRALHKLSSDGWDLDRPGRLLAAIAERHNIAYLDLRPALREAAASGPRLFYQQDLHWTAAGHEVVARALLDHLRDTP